MQKVDKPKKSLMVYYLIVLAVLVIMNLFLFPALVKEKVQEVDYGTFLTMLEEKKVATVLLDCRCGSTFYPAADRQQTD